MRNRPGGPSTEHSPIALSRSWMLAAGALGSGVAIYLVVDNDARAVGSAMALIGWWLVPITLFHVVPMWLSAMSWRALLPGPFGLGMATIAGIRWIRESVNSLLPVAGVGGDVVSARLAYLRGVSAPAAAGGMVVDITVGLVTQLVFVLLGLVLLLQGSRDPLMLSIAASVLAGLAIFVVAMAAFIVLQHKGLFGLSALLAGMALRGDWLAQISGHASRVDDVVRAIYRERRGLWRASLWRLAGWIAGMGEIWLAMYCLGQPIGLGDAMVLESLSSGIRAAAFMVPGAMGVLEGGFVLLGGALGIPPATALVLSLVKRVREIGLGLPGLLAWHVAEARRRDGSPDRVIARTPSE